MIGFNELSDSELVLLLKKGDQHAFRSIYDRYRPKVYSVALRMVGSPELAEEVMQEIMLKLWLSAANLQDDTTLHGYLKTLTRNRSYNVLRRLDLEAKTEKELSIDYVDFHNDTEEEILLNDTRKLLQEAISRLPSQQMRAYQLCHQEGLKYEEAAQRMNLSPLTVATHVKLALRFLRSYISDHTNVATMLVILGLLKK